MRTVQYPGPCDMNFLGEVEDYSVNIADASGYSPYRIVNSDSVSIAADENNFALFPNPSDGDFTINYSLVEDGPVNIEIYDIQGRQVTCLVDERNQLAGNYSLYVGHLDLSGGNYGIIVSRVASKDTHNTE